MYAFTILALPLALLGLTAWFQDPSRAGHTLRMALRGALLAVPAILLWLLLGFSYRPAWGSALLAGSFFLRFWALPYGLLSAAYALSCGYRGLERGNDFRQLAGFSFGFMSVFAVANAARLWGQPYFAWTLALPLLQLASVPFFAAMLEETVRDAMPDGIKWIAAMSGAFLASALALALLFLRLEWLGCLLAAGCAAGMGWIGWRRMAKRP